MTRLPGAARGKDPEARANGVRRTRLLRRAAWAFTTRRVGREAITGILEKARAPRAGDLVLARVEEIGHHRFLQLAKGRRKHLFVGDEIVVAYGNRCASNQFEAVVPPNLDACHLVSGGGIAAKALSWHRRIAKGPTRITPLGLLAGGGGKPANLRDHALPAMDLQEGSHPTTVALVGTGSGSGKSTSAALLVRGLTLAGLRVGYIKATGTGEGAGTWLVRDAGARPVLDFTDAGLASTYGTSAAEIERSLTTLLAHVVRSRVDAVVIELAEGVLQSETADLITSPLFRRIVGGILFAARDSMGAVAGHRWLCRQQLRVLGLSGVFTSAPLQCQEAAGATGLPIFPRQDLARPRVATKILAWAHERGPQTHGGRDDVRSPSTGTLVVPAKGPRLASRASGGSG